MQAAAAAAARRASARRPRRTCRRRQASASSAMPASATLQPKCVQPSASDHSARALNVPIPARRSKSALWKYK